MGKDVMMTTAVWWWYKCRCGSDEERMGRSSSSRSSKSSSRSSTIICNCNCSKEDQHKPLDTSSCTNCNCNKEGAKLEDNSTNKEQNIKSTPSTCSCKCHCACDCHKVDLMDAFRTLVLLVSAALGLMSGFFKGRGPGSVLMVQAGIVDKNRVLQKRLNKIADSADTSTVDGLNYVLKEVVRALLKHYDSCHFAYFYDKYDSSMDNSIKPHFKELLNREIKRHDKDENTFVNVGGVKYKATVAAKANCTDNEYSVVTVLLLASDFQLSKALNRSIGNMKLLLQNILSIPKNNIESVEVLWTPQREDETVSEQELRKDFPLMKRLKF